MSSMEKIVQARAREEEERERAREEMEASTSSAMIARQTWEIENNIVAMESPGSDGVFEYDEAAQSSIQQQKPWSRDPHFFKNVRISALALLKVPLNPIFLLTSHHFCNPKRVDISQVFFCLFLFQLFFMEVDFVVFLGAHASVKPQARSKISISF